MSRAAKQNLCSSGDQHVGETLPIFIVSIGDQRNFRILCDVPQPFELTWRNLFGFLINGRINTIAIEDEANRNNQWLAAGVGRRKVGNAGGSDKGSDVSAQRHQD
jgi:hypothetical protein